MYNGDQRFMAVPGTVGGLAKAGESLSQQRQGGYDTTRKMLLGNTEVLRQAIDALENRLQPILTQSVRKKVAGCHPVPEIGSPAAQFLASQAQAIGDLASRIGSIIERCDL